HLVLGAHRACATGVADSSVVTASTARTASGKHDTREQPRLHCPHPARTLHIAGRSQLAPIEPCSRRETRLCATLHTQRRRPRESRTRWRDKATHSSCGSLHTKCKACAMVQEMPERTVLVVDDNAENRALAEATLEDEGYRVVLANDGQQAIEAFSRESP